MKKYALFILLLLALVAVPVVSADAWNKGLFNTSNALCNQTNTGGGRDYLNAFDNNAGTYWQSSNAAVPAACMLRLTNQSFFNLNRIDIIFYDGSYDANGGEIYGSNDVLPNWTVGNWTYLTNWNNVSTSSANKSIIFNDNTKGYKWYLVNMTSVASPASPAILEYYLYGNLSIAEDIPGNFTPNVTFVNQTPADLTDSTLFNFNLSVTYQYNLTGLSVAFIEGYLNSSILTCVYVQNGTCITQNGSITTLTGGNSSANVTFNFSENTIYPVNQNTNTTTAAANVLNISSTNAYVADAYQNISTSQSYGYYEFQINGTGNVSVYYYNSSYDFSSNPATNANVHLICNVAANYTNHTHSGANWDNICRFIVNSTGFMDTTKVTSTGGFLIRSSAGTTQLFGYNGAARTNVTRTTTNGGNTWATQNVTLRSHLHQFSPTDRFCYTGKANYTTGSNPQSNGTRCDLLNITYTAPTPPTVFVPNGSDNYTRLINITYEASQPTHPNAVMSYYNITLLNSDTSFNQTIRTNNSLNTSYLWNSFAGNLDTNTIYYVRVAAVDNNSFTTYADSGPFTVQYNTIINVTVFNSTGGVVNNTNVTFENGTTTNLSTLSTGTIDFFAVRGVTYNITANSTNFSLARAIVTPTTNFTGVNLSLLTLNTFDIIFYNESTNTVLTNQTVRLEIISPVYAANFTTNTSRFNITMLTPSNYTIRYYVDSRVPRDYYVTLVPQSYNNLSLYVLDYDISQVYTPIVIDQNTVPVAGATISLLRYYVASNDYVVVEMAKTDTNGQAVLRVVPNVINYKLLLSYGSFNLVTEPQKYTSSTNTYTLSRKASPLSSYNAYPYITYNFTFLRSTNTFVVTWADTSNIVTGACLSVDKVTDGIRTKNYSGCASGSTGSTIHTVTNDNKSKYEATAFLTTNTTYSNVPLGTQSYDFLRGFENFGRIGLLLVVLVVIAVAFIGGENGTRGLVVTGTLALIFMGLFGIVPYTQEAIIGIVIIAGILIYKLRGTV